MNSKQYEFKYYNGKQILEEEQELLGQMHNVFKSRDCNKESVLEYLGEDTTVCCMFDGDNCVGFSWLAFCNEEHLAELCWFVTDKNKLGGLDAKIMLDEVLGYCKAQGVKSVKFNCFDKSWGRIKDREKLFKKFGFDVSDDEMYDMSIDV